MSRFVIFAAMATWAGSAGCAKPAPATAPAPATVCPPKAAAPAVSTAPPAAAAVDSPGDERMAVVVLMVPGGGGPNGPSQPHEYRLSLAADSASAAVEVDGQPMGAARVQHLSPTAIARLGTRGGPPPQLSGPALTPRPRPISPDLAPTRTARSRILPATMRQRELSPYGENPNGAPIID